MRVPPAIVACTLGLAALGSELQTGWTQLSLSTCGVDRFLAANPQSDGRGVVIAVLDTGVDPSIPGLTRTPTGEVKVIDVQDFTGQGDVELHRIRRDDATGQLINYDADGAPIQYEPPLLPPTAGEHQRCWWLGFFQEKKFINSDQPDINDNGKTDDEFPVLVSAVAGDGDDQAVCWVDTNLDRSFADEPRLRNYRLQFDTFTLWRDKPEKQIVPLTFAVNIFLRQSKLVIHFDDGGHGTHVAGIAAGWRINNQDGFNGVAPGARLMSLKIGNNALGGISTTESKKLALEYAARYARENNVPVVCNLSYGVESEIEGHSDIDKIINEVLRENPYLVFCTSAGNAGPGLSTVGTPAAASAAISVGALLAVDTARDVLGWTLNAPVVTVFSSRGGELDKPEIVCPGMATSTVPRWVRRGDFWRGTSMASPYAAGLCADLISHMQKLRPGQKVRAADVRRALSLSAQPVPGATALDAGWGLPDLPKAAEILQKLAAAAENDPVIGYEISTPCPHGYKGKAQAAYWRGLYFPVQERQTFTINPIFAPTADAAARTEFTRRYELRSNAAWCRLAQQTVYLRSEQPARVHVEYDPAQLVEPGVYVGLIEALADGLPAFRLLNTIVVPERFTAEGNYMRQFRRRLVCGWVPDRIFLAVPPGASAMKLRLAAPEGETSAAVGEEIHDPFGRQLRNPNFRLDTEKGKNEAEWTIVQDLCPGVWEAPIVSNRPDRNWPYDLSVRFFGLQAEPNVITEADRKRPAGKVVVTNVFEKPVVGKTEGQIEGYRFYREAEFKGLKDELSYDLRLDRRFNRLRLRLEMTPEDYAKTTDIAVMVLDEEGQAIYKEAFDWRIHTGEVETRGARSLKLVIHAGFARADDKRRTPVVVKVDQLLATPVPINFGQDGEPEVLFAPGLPVQLSYETSERLADPPEDRSPVGFLRVRERGSNDEVLRIPIELTNQDAG